MDSPAQLREVGTPIDLGRTYGCQPTHNQRSEDQTRRKRMFAPRTAGYNGLIPLTVNETSNCRTLHSHALESVSL